MGCDHWITGLHHKDNRATYIVFIDPVITYESPGAWACRRSFMTYDSYPFKLLNNRISSRHTTPLFFWGGGGEAVLKLDNDDMAQVYLWV